MEQRSFVYTPAKPPPVPKTLHYHGSTLYQRILQALVTKKHLQLEKSYDITAGRVRKGEYQTRHSSPSTPVGCVSISHSRDDQRSTHARSSTHALLQAGSTAASSSQLSLMASTSSLPQQLTQPQYYPRNNSYNIIQPKALFKRDGCDPCDSRWRKDTPSVTTNTTHRAHTRGRVAPMKQSTLYVTKGTGQLVIVKPQKNRNDLAVTCSSSQQLQQLHSSSDNQLSPENKACTYALPPPSSPPLADGDATPLARGSRHRVKWDGGGKHGLVSVSAMSHEERGDLRSLLDQSVEAAATLLFSDGSTQLFDQPKNPPQNTKPIAGSSSANVEIEGVCVALPVPPSKQRATEGSANSLLSVFFPLDASVEQLDEWCRVCLCSLMGRARVITYGGQELVNALISHYDLEGNIDTWSNWTVLDTGVASWLLNPDQPTTTFQQLLLKFNMHTIEPQAQEEHLWSLFMEMEVKLIPLLAAMEVVGIQVNNEKLLSYADVLKSKISQVQSSVHKSVGHPFSINSTVQLRQTVTNFDITSNLTYMYLISHRLPFLNNEVLFEELKLDEKCDRKLCRTQVFGHKSTSEAVLMQLQAFHPLPRLILEYRQLCKLSATYIDGILPFTGTSKKGILQPNWQHTAAATGRVISSNPNIQAFPKHPVNLGKDQKEFIESEAKQTEIDIRAVVESRPGHTFLAADFKSIELRLLASLSGDQVLQSTLLQSQRDSSDVFTLLTSQWLGKPLSSVTGGDREKTKRVVYAVIYGVGKDRLADILDTSPNHAKDLMTSFLGKFSAVQEFIQQTIKECRQKGCLVTISGRKRWFPDINSTNFHVRSHSERQAINFPIQGSAADICKVAMLDVMKLLTKESPNTKLVLQIHDELVFEVPDEALKETASKVKTVLEAVNISSSAPLSVPLEVRMSAGKLWSSLLPLHQ